MSDKVDGFTMFTLMVFGLLMVCVTICFLSLPLMLLWNWLIPVIFGLPTIDIFQAVGLGALSHILFGNTTKLIKESSTGHKKGKKKTLLFD